MWVQRTSKRFCLRSLSKKIASGSDRILLDVKTGSGAFMKTLDDSIALAREMVDIGTNVGRTRIA